MQVDFNNPKNRIYGSQFTAFQHFTHFIKPGWYLIDVKQPENKKIKIVVAINSSTGIKSMVIVSSDTIDVEINIKATIFKRMESIGDKNSTRVTLENKPKSVESLKIKANSVTSVMFIK
jgi:hypothetical protein